jgi:hypothetical protein
MNEAAGNYDSLFWSNLTHKLIVCGKKPKSTLRYEPEFIGVNVAVQVARIAISENLDFHRRMLCSRY